MESRRNRRNVGYQDNNKPKKRNKWKLISLILFVIMILIYNQVYILYKYTTGQRVTEKQIALYKWITSMTSSEAEVKESSINIGVVGNILLNDKLQESYTKNQELDFDNIFKHITLTNYDFVIANMDMTITEDNEYNLSDELFAELNRLNIKLLNVATENIADNEETDIKETINSIKEHKFSYVGEKTSTTDDNYYILEQDNIKIVILSYIGEEYADNTSLNVYSSKQLEKDLKKIEKENVDGTILFIDTLRSNEEDVEEEKKDMLKDILNKGIDVIISNDTVVQEIYNKKDSKNNKKYIVYSLGDFIGEQKQENSDVSKLLRISVDKKKDNGKMKVEFDVNFDKTFVALSNSEVTKCKVVDLEKEISEYKEEEAGNITTAEYHYLLDIKENME